MEIKSLKHTSFDTIFTAFSQAFADYELQLEKEELRSMLQRRGFAPELSFAAFDNQVIVAFTLNGIGHFNGILTAYDTGTGTLKEYRGQGLATKIFEYSIPYLQEKGIKQYLLEVLQHNTKAVSVYRKLGFEVVRQLNYFRQQHGKIIYTTKKTDILCTVKPVDITHYPLLAGFQDFHPSWQNSFESVRRQQSNFVSLGAYIDDQLAGYCIFEPVSGDITQLAVDKPHRRKGIASVLLQEMIRLNKHPEIKAINTDITCNSITAFLEAKGIELKGKQFEMIRKLTDN